MPQRLALPLQLGGDGRLVTLTQDSPAEIAQSVALLLATRPGERRSVPDYGTEDPMFSGIAEEDLHSAIEEWEDRADPAAIEIVTTGVAEYAQVYPGPGDEDVFA